MKVTGAARGWGIAVLVSMCAVLLIRANVQRDAQAASTPQQAVRKPALDAQRRFWVYGETDQPAPFIPHGWMPKEAAKSITQFDPDWRTDPHSGRRCLAIAIGWSKGLNWCGVAWMTKEKAKDGSPWWGQDASGGVYDLSGAKELVVWVRGHKGGERLQFKVGILGDKAYGDSTTSPIESKWLTLTSRWQRFALDLRGQDLSRVANGFTWVTSRDQQDEPRNQVRFFLDDIYFQF